MIEVYTIGFAQKNAEDFFQLLAENGVKSLFDIRLNNTSQLAGFTNVRHLPYFLKIHNMAYQHLPELAPTKKLLHEYKNKTKSWDAYELIYQEILANREIKDKFDWNIFHKSVLLCSEPTAERCHRRLFSEFIAENMPNTIIKHL